MFKVILLRLKFQLSGLHAVWPLVNYLNSVFFPQFPHLQNENNDHIYLTGLLWKLNEKIHGKCFELSWAHINIKYIFQC